MKTKTGLIRAAAAAVLLTPLAAEAQQNCAARDSVVGRLAAKYGESFAGGGLQNSTSIFEVWFSEEEGTWTILMTRADGMSCVMAAGTHWRAGLPGELMPMQGVPG